MPLALTPPEEKRQYRFDNFVVDPVRRRLARSAEAVPITPKAFSILLILLERRGEVVEKEELIRRVWGDAFVTEANLTQNVSSLRKALGERANDHRFVVTVPGRGYSFVSEVLEVPREATGEYQVLSGAAAGETGPPPAPEPAEPAAPAESVLAAVPPRPGDSGSFPMLPPLPNAPVASAPPVRGRRRFLFAGLVLGFA